MNATANGDVLDLIAGGLNEQDGATEDYKPNEALQEAASDGEDSTAEPSEEEQETGGSAEEGEKDPIQVRLENLERQNSILLKRLEEVTSKKEETREDTRKIPSIDIDFQIDDDTYERAMDSKEVFISVLKDLAKAIHSKSAETVMLHLPQLVGSQVTSQVVLQDAVNTFWRANKDLLPQQKFAGFVYKELEAQYPEMSAIEIIEKKLGPEVRKRLGIKGPAKVINQGGQKPNVAGITNSGQRLQPSKKLSGVAAEIAQLAGDKI